jgi:hypothetical protein
MFHADVPVAERRSLAGGAFQRPFRPRHKRQIPGQRGLAPAATPPPPTSPAARDVVERARSEARLHPPAHLVQVDPERAQRLGVALAQPTGAHQLAQRRAAGVHSDAQIGQHTHPGRRRLGQHAEQQMLGAQPGMPEPAGLVLTADYDLPGRRREPLKHLLPPSVLLVHRLPAHPQRPTDLLPGPAVPPRAVHLKNLQVLDQLPQRRHRAQAHARVPARSRGRRIDRLTHPVNLH